MMDPQSMHSHYVSISSPDRDDKHRLDLDAIQRVLTHVDAKDNQISILSVIGPHRSGKGSILGGLQAYLLKARFQKNVTANMELQNEDVLRHAWNDDAGSNPVGIYLSKQPVLWELNGKKIAIILIMTVLPRDEPENSEKERRTNEENAKRLVFLASFFCSLPIFAPLVEISDYYKRLIDVAENTAQTWLYATEPTIVILLRNVFREKYGFEAGKEELRKHKYSSSFECHFLPAPEQHVFQDRNADLGRNFLKEIMSFCRSLVQKCLITKHIGKRELSGAEMFECIKCMDMSLENAGKDIDSAWVKDMSRLLDCIDEYKNRLKLAPRDVFLKNGRLERYSLRIQEQIEEAHRVCHFSPDLRRRLKVMTKSTFGTYEKASEEISGILEKLGIQEAKENWPQTFEYVAYKLGTRMFFRFAASHNGLSLPMIKIDKIKDDRPDASFYEQMIAVMELWKELKGDAANPALLRNLVRHFIDKDLEKDQSLNIPQIITP